MSVDEVSARLASARERLLVARGDRAQPARDDKVLTSWNGLAMAAYAEAGRVLPGADGYTSLATGLAESLYTRSRDAAGRMRRSWKDGQPGPAGVLEDHTHLAAGLLALYQTTFDERWFTWASELVDLVVSRFADVDGGFHDTPDDAEGLFARPRSLVDSPLASGNAMAVSVLLELAALTGRGGHRDAAEASLAGVLPLAARHPTAFAQWLIGAGLLSVPIDEVAVLGEQAAVATDALLGVARSGYRPWQVIASTNDPAASQRAAAAGQTPEPPAPRPTCATDSPVCYR